MKETMSRAGEHLEIEKEIKRYERDNFCKQKSKDMKVTFFEEKK